MDKIPVSLITPVKHTWLARAQAKLDNLTKPPGSLGRLEELARRYVAIRESLSPEIRRRAVYVFAGDHGVVDCDVSAYPREVTAQMVHNFLNGGAAINALAGTVDAEVHVVDMGVDADFGPLPGLIDKKIRNGTCNIAEGPAMTRQEAETALATGRELARLGAARGVDVFGTGDMGIANTTPATTIFAFYGHPPIESLTGRGTGIDDARLERKIEIIRRAIKINSPDLLDPVDVLAKIGGFEIGGIAGLILGAAESRRAVFIDGLISGAAALLAVKLCPPARDYVFTSHRSTEPAHEILFNILNNRPLLDLQMRLGEGTVAVLGMTLLDAALAVFNGMATFNDAGVSDKVNPD